MTGLLEVFVLLMLSLLTFIDIRKKTLPSPLTTSLLFIVALVKIQNLEFGVLGFIFGLLMMEGLTHDGEFYSGLADLKMTVVLALMVSNIFAFILLIILILIYGVVYKAIIVRVAKKKGDIAFIPVFLVVYMTILLLEKIMGGIL
jgi:hypothetical protein